MRMPKRKCFEYDAYNEMHRMNRKVGESNKVTTRPILLDT
jgi:hypothetical protein